MPLWVSQLKCYDGTDPDIYQRKVEEKGFQKERIHLPVFRKGSDDTAISILRRVVGHSLTLPSTEHRENKEELASTNWLLVEREGHKKSRQFHDVLSLCFGYYFKKKEIKLLLKQYMRPRLGFDIILFFREFAEILKTEENSYGVLPMNEEESNPIWFQVMQRIDYLTICNAYLKRCEARVQNSSLDYLKKVLLDRASSRFQKSIEPITGDLDHLTFRKEINRVLEMALSMTKTNSLFSYFDRDNLGLLKGEEVTQALVLLTIELQKSPKKPSKYPRANAPPPGFKYSSDMLDDENSEASVVSYSSLPDQGGGASPILLPSVSDEEQSPSSEISKDPAQSAKEAFSQVVLKISTVLTQSLQQGSFIPLSIPDGFVNEHFIQISLADQLGIRLSRREISILCERIRRGNDNSNTSSCPPRESKSNFRSTNKIKSGTNSVLGSYLPPLENTKKNNTLKVDKKRIDDESSADIILGKYVKVFITSIKVMCSKRLSKQLGKRKPLFLK